MSNADAARTALVSKAASLPPSESIRVLLTMSDHPFDWNRVAASGADGAVRDVVLADRRAQMAGITGPVAKRLAALGASNVVEHWLAPIVTADVPAGAVADLAAWTDAATVAEDDAPSGSLGYGGGQETRNGMRANAFINAGYRGQSGNRTSGASAMRVATMENAGLSADASADCKWPLRDHYGFRKAGLTVPRTWKVRDCSGGSCVDTASASTVGRTHHTDVLKELTGSVEAGQDPAVSDPVERRRRSGVAPEALWSFYGLGCPNVGGGLPWSTWSLAIADAVAQGHDVLNVSAWIGGLDPCDLTSDPSGIRASIRNAVNAGMIVVVAAGNDGDGGGNTCKMKFPATDRNVIAVGGLASDNSTWNYDTLGTGWYSSRGGMNITTSGTLRSHAVAGVDIAAPGGISWDYWIAPNAYDIWNTDSATSYAAPHVAAGVLLFRQALVGLGLSSWNTARRVLTNTLLMGDGYSFDTGTFRASTFDQRTGAGRMHAHFPGAANLIAPWGWGVHDVTVSQGSDIAFTVNDAGPESASVTQWKVAMTWDEPNFGDGADIDLYVYNTCPAGGGGRQLVAAQADFDVRNRITLTQSQISGRCLEYHLVGHYVPAGQTRTVYVADYYHSGNPAEH